MEFPSEKLLRMLSEQEACGKLRAQQMFVIQASSILFCFTKEENCSPSEGKRLPSVVLLALPKLKVSPRHILGFLHHTAQNNVSQEPGSHSYPKRSCAFSPLSSWVLVGLPVFQYGFATKNPLTSFQLSSPLPIKQSQAAGWG